MTITKLGQYCYLIVINQCLSMLINVKLFLIVITSNVTIIRKKPNGKKHFLDPKKVHTWHVHDDSHGAHLI